MITSLKIKFNNLYLRKKLKILFILKGISSYTLIFWYHIVIIIIFNNLKLMSIIWLQLE